MLFAAGTGLAQLDRVRDDLQKELEGLYKTRNASVPTINKALGDLKTAREVVKQDALKTADWVDANTRLQSATAARAEVTRQRREVQADLDRSHRWLDALHVIPRRQEVADRLASRGQARVLRPRFAENYHAEAEASRLAGRAVSEAQDNLAQAETDLAELGPADPISVEAEAIHRLHADLGRYTSARRDRPELLQKLGRVEAQATAIRAEIPKAVASPGASLATLRDPIQALAQERAGLLVQKGEAEGELARLATLDPTLPGAAAIPAVVLRWLGSLEEALTRATAVGNLEAQRLKARAKLDAAEAEAATSLRGLSLWSGTLESLEALPIPPDATFDRFDQAIRAAEEDLRAAEANRVRLEGERINLDRAAELARVGGAIPTAADLDAHRARRDALWQTIRRGWVDHEPIAPAPARLADDFEAESRQADAVSDALRHAADRVAAEAQRAIDRRSLADQIALAVESHASALAERLQAFEAWAEHWRPLGIEPMSPREMKDWVRVDRKERLRCGKSVRDARAEVDRITGQIDELREELGQALARVAEPARAVGESLAALLARGNAVVSRIKARVERDAVHVRLAEVVATEARWLDRWAGSVAPLGLPPEASVATANAVIDRLDEWVNQLREARTIRATLDDSEATERRFAAEAQALADRLDREVAEPIDDWQPIVLDLMARLKIAGETQTRRASLQARIDEERSRLARSQAALARADEAIRALATEAGVASAGGLPAAIRESAAIEADLADLHRLDEQLDTFAGTMPRAAFLEAVHGLDEATLAGRIADAGATLAELEADSHRLGEAVGASKEQLDQMDRSQGAADAEQAVQDHAARLGADVERYARLKLASAVLRDAVERHRAKNQGPVLDRAGALFARLTNGSFTTVQADQDDKGEPILRGVRGTNAPINDDDSVPQVGPLVDVAAMSEGTADQLYLALRLASLSVHLDDPDHEPVPLVADDILINFDDVRALAALEALVDLSRRTQVLFFTHHDHLAEIARSCLPADAVFIHRLIPVGDEPAPSAALGGPKARRKRSSSVSLADPVPAD